MIVNINGKSLPLDIEEFEKNGQRFWKLSSQSRLVRERVVKGFQDRKWMGGRPPNWDRDHMYYVAPINSRNLFHLSFYDPTQPDPYEIYKKPLEEFPILPMRMSQKLGREVPPLAHQRVMANHFWTRRACHISAEMRTGKTLPVLSVAEFLQKLTWIIAPRSAIAGITLELWNWGINLDPVIMTYDELVKRAKQGIDEVPQVVIFDESTRLKTWSTLRSGAAFHLTEGMREEYGDEHWVTAMSGTPAPKDPTDIWSQVEIVRPGYLYESRPQLLRNRLSLIEYRDNETGGQYPHLITWFDDPKKCATCGAFEGEHEDNPMSLTPSHPFIPSKNEIRALGERLVGMSVLFKKKECLDLPDKIMERRELKPTPQIMQYAQQIMTSGKPKMVIINDLLQLSAGFYYKMVDSKTETVSCPNCYGEREQVEIFQQGDPNCYRCKGAGKIPRKIRHAIQVECPKDKEMIDLLEECEESGRFVAFGSFQGCLDRMKDIAVEQGWSVIRVDSRGWCFFECHFNSDHDALKEFAADKKEVEKIAFIAHPKSGGEGISLSAASTIMFWNNGFDGGARMQAQERGSDLGMDMSKGCRVVDLLLLKVDYLALENLDRKQEMQDLALEELL